MSAARAWDRAASRPVPATRRPRPEIATLGRALPGIAELFTFMRDAELRWATLLMQIEERTVTARGELVTRVEVAIRHPGMARVRTAWPVDGPGPGRYEVWLSDGETVRTYDSSRRLGTRRPVRPRVRGATDRDLPGMARVYTRLTALPTESLPELFVHPAGYCQNVLATGACAVTGTSTVAGREAIVVECAHPRTVEVTADRPDYAVRLNVDRGDGVILRLEQTVAGVVTRDAIVTRYEPNAALPPGAFELAFPPDTTLIY